MRTATIQNRTYRNALGNCQARVIVKGTDALRKQLADAFFPARHVVRHPGVSAQVAHLCEHVGLTSRRSPCAKQAAAGAACMFEAISSSMSGPQRSTRPWAAERGPRAFVTSA